MDQVVVDELAGRVRKAMGDQRAFAELFESIVRHPRVRQAEAAALAMTILGRLPAGSSRREALRRLYAHHRRLVDVTILERRTAA